MTSEEQYILDELAYQMEIHCATLEQAKCRKSTSKCELKRFEDIVIKGILTLRSFKYTSNMAQHNRKKTPRVFQRIKESEELEKMI